MTGKSVLERKETLIICPECVGHRDHVRRRTSKDLWRHINQEHLDLNFIQKIEALYIATHPEGVRKL
jgi:uncharacterized C2H2 Zn-finger protein